MDDIKEFFRYVSIYISSIYFHKINYSFNFKLVYKTHFMFLSSFCTFYRQNFLPNPLLYLQVQTKKLTFFVLFLPTYSSTRDTAFVERVRCNAARYVQLFYEAIDKNMPQPTVNLRDEDMTAADVIMEQRIHNLKMTS